jgi:hypothetical protein
MDDPLKRLIERRHPEYAAMKPHWDFVGATYEGGRAWFDGNIFRYFKEGDEEYADRVLRAHRFNHTREVVDLVDKYLFKVDITRREDDAPSSVKNFWKKATRNGLDMQAYVRRISNKTSTYGRVWIVVDSNAPAVSEGGAKKADLPTVADEKAGAVQIYSYIVLPQQVLDMSYADDGSLNWILIHEVARDDQDPMASSGTQLNRFRLWTRDEWKLYEVKKEGRKLKVMLLNQGVHGLGEVPVFPADHTTSDELYCSEGLIDDIAYMDRAIANYLSNLDAIIQDQTFSQLAMPAQGLMPGDEGEAKMKEVGTKRIFTYDGSTTHAPEFISPDPKQAQLILSAIAKITSGIYQSVGLSAERNNNDGGTSQGDSAASGVAKAYDFERVNSLLSSKAASLRKTEERVARLVALWAGQLNEFLQHEEHVEYPDNFDVRGLYDEFEIAARLTLLNAPEAVRRAQMKLVINKLFPLLPEDELNEMLADLKDWPPEDLLALGASGKPTGAGGPIKAASAQKTAKELTA